MPCPCARASAENCLLSGRWPKGHDTFEDWLLVEAVEPELEVSVGRSPPWCAKITGKERKRSSWRTLPHGESYEEWKIEWGQGLHYTCCLGQEPSHTWSPLSTQPGWRASGAWVTSPHCQRPNTGLYKDRCIGERKMWGSAGRGFISFYFKKIRLSDEGLSGRLNMKHRVPFGSITLKGAISCDLKALLGS